MAPPALAPQPPPQHGARARGARPNRDPRSLKIVQLWKVEMIGSHDSFCFDGWVGSHDSAGGATIFGSSDKYIYIYICINNIINNKWIDRAAAVVCVPVDRLAGARVALLP